MLLGCTIAIVIALAMGLHARETGRRHAAPSFAVSGALLLVLLVLALNNRL